MNSQEIREIKTTGANSAVRSKIGSLLWAARKHLETAPHEFFVNFDSDINNAEVYIKDAKTLYRALPESCSEEGD